MKKMLSAILCSLFFLTLYCMEREKLTEENIFNLFDEKNSDLLQYVLDENEFYGCKEFKEFLSKKKDSIKDQYLLEGKNEFNIFHCSIEVYFEDADKSITFLVFQKEKLISFIKFCNRRNGILELKKIIIYKDKAIEEADYLRLLIVEKLREKFSIEVKVNIFDKITFDFCSMLGFFVELVPDVFDFRVKQDNGIVTFLFPSKLQEEKSNLIPLIKVADELPINNFLRAMKRLLYINRWEFRNVFNRNLVVEEDDREREYEKFVKYYFNSLSPVEKRLLVDYKLKEKKLVFDKFEDLYDLVIFEKKFPEYFHRNFLNKIVFLLEKKENNLCGFINYKEVTVSEKKEVLVKEEENESHGYISILLIDKKYRGRGLALKLLQMAETIAKERKNVKFINLITSPHLDEFYSKHGFKLFKENYEGVKNRCEYRKYLE